MRYTEFSRSVRDNVFFQWSIVAIIVTSSLTIGARTYEINAGFSTALFWTDIFITVFFLMEIIVRLLSERPWYRFFHYQNRWNWFDFIIVVSSLIPLEDGSYVLLGRLLRLFRVMRLISFIPELRVLASALLVAIPRMGYVVLMMFVIFYMYATLGSLLFEAINPVLWGDVGYAMLTLFRVATLEDWTDVMYETMVFYPWSWVFYVSFIFLSAFVFLNMMIGIVINVLEEEHSKENRAVEAPLDEKLKTLQLQLDQLERMLKTKVDSSKLPFSKKDPRL